MKILKSLTVIGLVLFTAHSSQAQAPNGYYNRADSLIGDRLQDSLYKIIRNHNSRSYNDLWTGYRTTDRKANGKVWDMYSDRPNSTPAYEYTFGTNQCGNYSGEGSCYNREHSWPRSWFNDASVPENDIMHVVPTDGYVNGRRGNHAFGVVTNPTWTSTNGSKLGTNTYPGAPATTAFEPIDEYKGDFARIYFYMSTRYKQEDGSWRATDMTDKAVLKPWAINMLLEWHYNDPVSTKELDRNNAVYAYQRNRNPFVDRPEFVDCIWNLPNCPWNDNTPPPPPPPEDTTSIESIDFSSYITIWPNPANDYLNVTLPKLMDEKVNLEIINMHGIAVMQQEASTRQSNHISIAHLPNGIYLVKVHYHNQVGYKKFIKQ